MKKFTIFIVFLFSYVARTWSQPTQKPHNELKIISEISISGNKTTKERIILRELPFKKGDTLSNSIFSQRIRQGRENLLNKPLFNFVTIDTLIDNQGFTKISIQVEERWYLWPTLMLKQADRNFTTWLESKDLSKLIYGLGIEQYNFRGANEVLKINYIGGYNQTIELLYRGLYLDRRLKHGITLSSSFSRQHQIAYQTLENKPIYFKSEKQFAIQKSNQTLKYLFRNRLYNEREITISYNTLSTLDSLISLNENYIAPQRNTIQFLALSYNFRRDVRDKKYYALNGYYLDLLLTKYFGLGQTNLPLCFGTAIFYTYYPINERFNISAGLKVKKNLIPSSAYFFQQCLGYYDNLRGYEHYVIDGQNFVLYQSSLKYAILPTQISTIHWYPLNKFPQFNKIHYAIYANLFLDYGYVWDKSSSAQQNHNSLSNSHLYSYGLGIDLVTYYDKVVRIDFARNRQAEKGIFITFKAPF